MKGKLITVAGTMGVGKTTLARHLAKRCDFHLLEEDFAENPFLKKFYKHPKHWAFHSQLFFLNQKAKALATATRLLEKVNVIVDAPIVQYAESYVAANVKNGNIKSYDHALYQQVYKIYKNSLPKEDIIIFLSASFDNIVNRIRNRDRGFEKQIDIDYLRLLHEFDRQWFAKCGNGLKIETDGLNLVNNRDDIDKVIGKIEKYL